MDWSRLLSTERLGLEDRGVREGREERSQFQRDYDRIIFSSPFRRLQNKTQVFPLPGSVFVHNRLTHSLEVASVGRSLGTMLSNYLLEDRADDIDVKDNLLVYEIGSAVATACLAHDLGNPPFGHSGEAAISNFFSNGAGKQYRDRVSPEEWSDFIRFDGNANAFRLLSHQFAGRREGGFALTYTTLASVVKYPYEAHLSSRSKFGFFQSDRNTFQKIAEKLSLIPDNTKDGICFKRHPLVYLVEAADDICYQIMDIEDAFKLKILDFGKAKELLLSFFEDRPDRVARFEDIFSEVTDKNEQIGFLRANVIGKLIGESMEVFKENYDAIMSGTYLGSLIMDIDTASASAMRTIQELSMADIYEDKRVVEIEIAGYQILGTLVEEFTQALFSDKSVYRTKILSLVPQQYRPQDSTTYSEVLSIIDFVSGMTDVYALDLFRKIKGISVPQLL